MLRKTQKFVLFVLLPLSLPIAVSAYTDTPIQGSMIVDVSPTNPVPGGTVTLKATSYSADLNRATISWSSNGTIFTQGTGLRSVTVKVGPAGSQTNIRIAARTPEGDTLISDLGFRPAGVDLLWQAHTSVPAYYGGRALPTSGSRVTVIAEPDFIDASDKKLDQGNLTYTWTRNNNKLDDASGFGKYYLEISDTSPFTAESIGVTVTDVSGLIIADSSVTIPVLKPRAVIYEEDPLEGTKFGRALVNFFNLLTEEVTLRGEPYFYPLSRPATPTWTVNNQVTSADNENQNLLTLREPANQSGIASLTYSTDNGAQGQSVQVPLSIRFGTSQIKF